MDKVREIKPLDAVTKYWNGYYNSKLLRNRVLIDRELAYKIFENTTGTLLDVGCGSGALVQYMIQHQINARGVDLSDYAVKHANMYISDGRFKTLNVDARGLGKNGSFNTVACVDTLPYLVDPAGAVGKMLRAAINRVIIVVPNGRDRIKPDAFWSFTADDLTGFLGKGSTVEEIRSGTYLFGVKVLEEKEGDPSV